MEVGFGTSDFGFGIWDFRKLEIRSQKLEEIRALQVKI